MIIRKDGFNLTSYKKTPNGYLSLTGIVTREGVFKYTDGNELRPAEQVFNDQSMDTMFAIPVTWEHPDNLLTPETTPEFQKGFVAGKPKKVKIDDKISGIELSDIIIQDPGLIYEIEKNNIGQFSLGYTCNLVDQPGRFDNEDYSRIQNDIVYNHLAVVKSARCGKVCSIIDEGDSMAEKSQKKDCADMKKDESSAMSNAENETASEVKKDEDAPAWAGEMMSMLKGIHDLLGQKKDESDKDKSEEKAFIEGEDVEKKKEEGEKYDSFKTFEFPDEESHQETKNDSDFTPYSRKSYMETLKGKN